jgi:hypothetical protein
MNRFNSVLSAMFLSMLAIVTLVLIPLPPGALPEARAQTQKKKCLIDTSACPICNDYNLEECEDSLQVGDPGSCIDTTDHTTCAKYAHVCGKATLCADPTLDIGFCNLTIDYCETFSGV